MLHSQALATTILSTIGLFMTRTLLIFVILAWSFLNGYGQTKGLKFDRMRISHNGDSLIMQEYELIIKSKKIYFITPFANHLHIKGGKYRTRVKFDKTKREKIFNLIEQLRWTNLEQVDKKEIKNKYFGVVIFSSDNSINNFKVPEELLPTDFKELYDTLTRE